MNDDLFSGKWHKVKGKIKEKWGKLTDDDLMRINGKREQMLGALKERYGWEKDRAEDELKRFEDHCRECCAKGDHSSCCHGEHKGSCEHKHSMKDPKSCCGKDTDWDDKSKKRKIG